MGNSMKHLLIILSILLLSSCTNKKGVIYRHGEVNDLNVYFWDEFGNREFNPIYEGDINYGKPYGFGILTFL